MIPEYNLTKDNIVHILALCCLLTAWITMFHLNPQNLTIPKLNPEVR